MANSAPQRYLKKSVTSYVGVWDVTCTLAAVNALTANVVPGVTGYKFTPVTAQFMCLTTHGAGPTTVLLFEEGTIGSVVLSHVIADMDADTWVGRTGGTAVSTLLNNLPLTVSKGVNLGVAGGTALITSHAVRAIVSGYYILA